jgi:hypothetical protein
MGRGLGQEPLSQIAFSAGQAVRQLAEAVRLSLTLKHSR